MTETITRPGEAHLRNIAALAVQLRIPARDVGAIYQRQYKQLAAMARISTYIGVLAMSSTRSILRQQSKRATAG